MFKTDYLHFYLPYQTETHGTVVAASSVNPADDAESIRKALDGWSKKLIGFVSFV